MGEHRWKAGGGALRSLAIAAVIFISSPAAAQPLERWSGHIAEASDRFGVPKEWIRRVMRAESGGRTTLNGSPITSRAGAMGLMQLMPRTWAEMRDLHGLGPDPHDPRDNILAGTAYLRAMHDRFGYPGLFAAYNAGPSRYAEHLANDRRLPAETVAYVAAVGWMSRRRPAVPSEKPQSGAVFVALMNSGPPGTGVSPPPAASGSLFVRLGTASAPSQ